MNIISINGVLHVTDKETFPTKPHPMNYEEREWKTATKIYRNAVADFIRDCTPIRSEDQEKVREVIWYFAEEPPLFKDGTIYKINLEMEEINQWFVIGHDEYKNEPVIEYRKSYRLVEETKEESQEELWRTVFQIEGKLRMELMSNQYIVHCLEKEGFNITRKI